MSQSTSLKVPPKLMARVRLLASRSGKTPLAWITEALEQQAEMAELGDAAEEIDRGGPVFAAEDVHAWILARAAGKPARKPKALPGTRRA